MLIPFEKEYRKKFYKILDGVFDSNFLSEGPVVKKFEELSTKTMGLHSSAICNGGQALEALLRCADVKAKDVIVPSNTYMCDVFSVRRAGGNVVFADCNKADLCLSVQSLKEKVTPSTKAVILVHIGGHMAFESFEIAEYCYSKRIELIEDCAHVHGASFKGASPGSLGMGGFYSFYSTKTMPLGEGGLVVSKHESVIKWINDYRNYGKFEYKIEGTNCRMSEIMAAFGIVQYERLPKILEWKKKLAGKFDKIFKNRVKFPKGMKSGYYKYIVFDENLKETTGKVFSPPCHVICKTGENLPNTDWVSEHHSCAPIWYGWEHSSKSVDEIRKILLGTSHV